MPHVVVGVHRRRGGQVGYLPLAQSKAFGAQRRSLEVGNSGEALAGEGGTAPKPTATKRAYDLAAVNGGRSGGDGSPPAAFVEVIVIALEGHPRNADARRKRMKFVERRVTDKVTPQTASMRPSRLVDQDHRCTYFMATGER
jgi:hypothetical protein